MYLLKGNHVTTNQNNLDPVCRAWKNFLQTGQIDTNIIRKEIAESWKRCVSKYKLDPYAPKRPIRLSCEDLDRRRKENIDLITISEPFLQLIKAAVEGSGFIITLTDPDAYVLEVLGDEEILRMAAENNYLPGCCRTEEEVGTNGIGLSLYLKRAIQITGSEHFNINHHFWTCSSSPICSPKREILGAITLSGKSNQIHQHTIGMVISAAKAIENKIVEQQLSQEKSSVDSYLDSLLDFISEGIIAIDNDYTIIHINRVAEKMLSISKDTAMGKSVNEVINCESPAKEIIENGKDVQVSDREILLNLFGKSVSFILSMKPVSLCGRIMGKILIFTEKRRVYELIHRFTGGTARFSFDDIKGRDPKLIRQIELAKIVSETDSRVLLVGESGTGKELFAQAIHNRSKRGDKPFVAISCAAIPRELIEAELFGYKGGAFTGSRKEGQIGKFELADRGTLFLDEVSSMPLEMQVKLLRVLQENEIVRLGDSRVREIDIRIIAATNRDLMQEVQSRNFREDLYFRLSVVEIQIPPLRERLEDIPYLARNILQGIAIRHGKDRIEVSDEVFRIFETYSWPGNVRELENSLERAALISETGVIRCEHLPERLFLHSTQRVPSRHIEHNIRSLRDEEKTLITEALLECKGNISEASRDLHISRSTLYRRLKAIGFSPHHFH